MPLNYGYADSGLMRQPDRKLQGLQATLAALQQHNQQVDARPTAMRPRPVANAGWMQAQGFNPQAGLGGVGGQYTPPLALGGAPGQPGARVMPWSPQAMMDPRQRNFQGGGVARQALPQRGLPNVRGYAIPQQSSAVSARGRQSFQEAEDAGVGMVDPATGAFIGADAIGGGWRGMPDGGMEEGNFVNIGGLNQGIDLPTPREQRMAGLIGRLPGGPGIDPAALAGRAAFTANRRATDMAGRRELVNQRGIANAEARRLRMGNMTFDERLQAGLPGFAVAREQGGAMRDVAQIGADAQLGVAGVQAGAQRDLAAANERIAQLTAASQQAIATGDQTTRMAIAKEMTAAQRDATRAQNKIDKKRIRAGESSESRRFGLLEREQQTKEAAAGRAEANEYRQAAQAAAANGDYEAYQRYTQIADSLLTPQSGLPGVGGQPAQAGTGGLPGVGQQQGRTLPANLRQIMKDRFANDPQGLVDELRRGGMSDQEINRELAQIYGQGSMLGMSTGIYDRTTDNPTGWGFETVDPSTGEVGTSLLGSLFPTRRSVERDKKRNPGFMYEQFP